MASDDPSAPPSAGAEPEAPGALAFVHDRGRLARRFLLAELLAPPLALRLRSARRPAAHEGSAPEPAGHDGSKRGR